ncbi:MAG: AAA family ATPase, partial [Firmicutes bacterium]|nr:AAA family ATPase [Bacillota bacterium]
GKTTLACNLAVALKAKSSVDLKVCLVDLDVSFGNAEAVLQVDAKRNILDWGTFGPEEFDQGLVSELVTRHKSGLDLVLSPVRAHEATQIKGELAGKVLKTLSRYYDVIICDVGPYLQADSTIVALDMATKILIIGTTDVPTLRNLHNCTSTFDVLGVEQAKIRMVFNRMIKKHGLSMKEVNQYIPYPIVGKIYEDESVQRLANDGKLAVLDFPNGAFAAGILKTVNSIIPVCLEEKKRGLFGWFKRRRDKQ